MSLKHYVEQAVTDRFSDMEAVFDVNNYVNKRVRYVADERNYKQKDYWATPLETLKSRKGDCEDYAIAKYYLLKELGIPSYLMYCKWKSEAHMVCLVKDDGGNLRVLDNIDRELTRLDLRHDLKGIYALDDENVYVIKDNELGKSKRLAHKITRWADLQTRINN